MSSENEDVLFLSAEGEPERERHRESGVLHHSLLTLPQLHLNAPYCDNVQKLYDPEAQRVPLRCLLDRMIGSGVRVRLILLHVCQ